MAVTANKIHPLRGQAGMFRPAPLAGALSVWMALLASPAAALEWDFTPTVGGSATFTDNVDQSANNAESSFILTATPGFSLQSRGSQRVQAGMFYSLTGVTRTGEGQDDSLYSSLSAKADAELVDDFLFLDASAGISQQLISLLDSQADASVNDSNRATTGSYSISPYIKQRFGNFADAELRYSATGALFENDAANDIYSNTLSGALNSGNTFNSLFWGMNFSMRDATTRGGEDTRFEHYDGTLGYGITRHLQIFGTLGYDSNEYTSVSGSETSGESWTVGMTWAPNRRTDIEASFGESYFGRTYGLNLNYRNSHTVWTVSYDDGVSDISQQLLNTQPFYVWDCGGVFVYGDPVIPPEPGCTPLGIAPPGSVPIGLSNGVFVSKSFRAAAAWSKGRSTLGLSLNDTRREYQQVAGTPGDSSRGVTLNYGYRLQPLTTFNAGFLFTNTQSPASLGSVIDRDDNFYSIDLGLSHQFGERLSSALVYRHQWRDSNDPTAEYTENNITASANLSF
jgi:uncharacterized protein (PEP-CTERM system associated)